MTVSTAVPNGYSIANGSWSAYTGSTAFTMAASAVAAVSDSSNNTYVRATAIPPYQYANLVYDMTNPTLGGSALARMRVTATMKNGDGAPVLIAIAAGTSSNDTYVSGAVFYPTGTTAVNFATGWLARGTPFSQTTGNAAQAVIAPGSTAVRITSVRIEYDLASIPTATPSIVAANTDRPTVTWTFADTDGYVQASAIVKVFSSAQINAAGFSASTSTPLWGATVSGTANTATPGTPIVTNGLYYKPYLLVYKNLSPTAVPSASYSSAAAYSQASWTAPASPSITTTWDNTYKRVQINTTGLAAPYQTIIFRGTAIGTANDPNYTVIKQTTDADGAVIAYDHFVPRGTPIVYGVYVTTGTVTPFLSSTATLSTVTTGSATSWELRGVDQPAAYLSTALPVTAINFDVYEGQTVFRPLGSNYPVVVAGDIGGDDGTMTIVTTSQTTWDTIKSILDLQSNLYLVSPFVDSNNLARRWFIRVTGRSWVESGVPSAQVRTATVSFVEVEPPAIAAD